MWEKVLREEERTLLGLEDDYVLYSQNLMRSLGRKEGELEGFKDLLDKAQNALQQSEDAVEVSLNMMFYKVKVTG